MAPFALEDATLLLFDIIFPVVLRVGGGNGAVGNLSTSETGVKEGDQRHSKAFGVEVEERNVLKKNSTGDNGRRESVEKSLWKAKGKEKRRPKDVRIWQRGSE